MNDNEYINKRYLKRVNFYIVTGNNILPNVLSNL
jgi:hypothetical protein